MDLKLPLKLFKLLGIVFLSGSVCLDSGCHDIRLLQDLFDESKYDSDLMPYKYPGDYVQVSMDAALFQILDVDERRQVVELILWFDFAWEDPHLTWNVSEYGGQKEVVVSVDRLWLPDLVVYNSVSVDHMGTDVFAKTPLTIKHDGNVMWNTLSVLEVSCKIHVYFFPFDIQRCSIQVGSWTQVYDNLRLALTNDTVDMSNYATNGEWDVLNTSVILRNITVDGEPQIYPLAVFIIDMQRKPLYFLVKFVLPGTLLVLLGVMAFILPSDTGDKIALHTTILLTVVVFQLMTADSMPTTSESVPLLTQYFASCVIILTLSTALSVVSVTICTTNLASLGNRAPPWLRGLIFRYLSSIVILGPATTEALQIVLSEDFKKKVEKPQATDKQEIIFNEIWNTRKNRDQNSNDETTSATSDYIPPYLQLKMGEFFDSYMKKQEKKERKTHIQLEWRVLSSIIDRALYYLFIFISLVTSCAIFLQKYNVVVPSLESQ